VDAEQLKANQWYWVRRHDGTLAPYRFHAVRRGRDSNNLEAEFFVGSMLTSWPLSHIVAEAQMPESMDR